MRITLVVLILVAACGGDDGVPVAPDAAPEHDAEPETEHDAAPPDATPPDATPDDPCEPDPCSGHGDCASDTGDAVCTCDEGYASSDCGDCEAGYLEYPPSSGTCIDDPCDPDPCGANGTGCSASTGSAVCTCAGHWNPATMCTTCAAGYTGADCESCAAGYYSFGGACVDNPCDPDPCNGHGACANGTGAAVCTCTGNWTGATCNACVAGYTGTDCETNIDDCADVPCRNAGTCTDLVNGFSCACKGAWDGATCEDIYYNDVSGNSALQADTVAVCEDETLLDLTDWAPDPNPTITDPYVQLDSCGSTTMVIESNSVPHYEVDTDHFANDLVPTVTNYTLYKTPTFNSTVTIATVVGGVGVAINGVQISSPSASQGVLQFSDPAAVEADNSGCLGHPNPSGKYHYHSMKTSCFFPQADNGTVKWNDACTAPSPIIGWIADGYPIKGPCECLDEDCTQVVEMRSSWTRTATNSDQDCAFNDYAYTGSDTEESDGDAYLDECSGHYGPDGDYHYHATNEYPWTLRCYRGTPYQPQQAMGRAYNDSSSGNDCCFAIRCTNGDYNSGGDCSGCTGGGGM